MSPAKKLSCKHLCYMASARSSCKDLLERILPGFPQNLLTRTCARSCKDLLDLENFSRIFTRSSQKGLYKILQGTLTGFHQNLHNFFKTLAKIVTYYAPLRLHHETLARSSKKNLPDNREDLLTRVKKFS
jgi:hypothetical protein